MVYQGLHHHPGERRAQQRPATPPPPHLPVPLRELRGSYSLREDLLPVV